MEILARRLRNGVLFPAVSLGTAHLDDDESFTVKAVNFAISIGYKGIDTAYLYTNEKTIGKVVREFNEICTYPLSVETEHFKKIKVEDFLENFKVPHGPCEDNRQVFVSTKIWWDSFSEEGVKKVFDYHTQHFKRNRIDQLLLHWPGIARWFPEYKTYTKEQIDALNCDAKRIETWKILEKYYAEGKVRVIGVSNYMEHHLKPLIDDILERQKNGDKNAVLPMTNQIECSILCTVKPALQELCDKYDIMIISYATMARQRMNRDEKVLSVCKPIMKKYNVSLQQLMLRWALEKGYAVLPKSQNEDRIASNLKCTEFTLNKEDIECLEQLNIDFKTCGDPYTIN